MYNDVDFVWDEEKLQINLRKHHVHFEDALLVFEDPNVIVELDRIDNETGEDRWHAIGLAKGIVLLLCSSRL